MKKINLLHTKMINEEKEWRSIEEITSVAELNEHLEANAEDAEKLYQKSLAFGIKNSQEFINWQDRLNAVSILPPE